MPSLPTVTSDIPRDLRQFLDRVRENINGRGEDELVTVRKLVAAGIAEYSGGALSSSTDGTYYPTPPAPTGIDADGALANIVVTWDKPAYNGHAYTEIWSAQQTTAQADADPEEFPDLGEATLVGMAPGQIWVDNIGGGGSRWYWLRFVNVEGQVGPYNAVDGTRGDTATDPSHLIDLLSGQISASELASSLSSRIDLIDGPSTTAGTVAAQIATIQNQVNELLNLPEWDSATTYAADDQVVYNGFLYNALAASTNVTPGTDDTKWEQIGEYATLGAAVAAHTTQIGDLEDDLGTEVTNRTTLASQLRGDYTGDDLSLVSQGLIFEERTARSTAVSSLAQDIQTLTAFTNTKSRVFYQAEEPTGTADEPLNVGDMWIDTDITYADDYVEGDYVIRSNRMYRYDGTNWVEAMDFGFADWFSAIRTEKEARVEEDEALATSITTLTTSTNNSLATINSTLSTHTTDIASNASAITSLGSTVTANNNTLTSAIQSEAQTRSSADSTNAQAITTLQSTVNSNNQTLTAAIQAEAATRAEETGDLFGQYTVKIDLNGYVSGYGLASSVVDGTPTSNFIVRADSFAIGQPTNDDPTHTPDYPFIVRTSSTTINGETVLPGVYMEDAFIANGTITNAKIGNAAIDDAKIANLNASKITAGFISSDRIAASSITASMIDSRGLSIKDADGNVILSAGTPLSISNIEGLGSLAAFSELSLSDINEVGALASLDEVSQDDLETGLAGKIDGKIESHFQDSDDDPSGDWEGDQRILHLGDLWWQTDNNTLHRYKYDSVDGGYEWEQITDQKATDAFANAATAQDTADSKRRVFVAQPVPPYDVGDLWDRGSTTGIWRSNANKTATQSFAAGDWVITADVTGNNTAASISNQGNLATVDFVAYTNLSTNMQGLVDGKVESFFQDSDDDPADDWTTTAIKTSHLGDFWWQTDTNKLKRFKRTSSLFGTNQYVWESLTDQTAIDAFSNAATAQDTADGKRRVFVNTPTAPYDIGDLWDRGTDGGLWRCQTARAADADPAYAISDWAVAADVTSLNTAAGIENQGSLATLNEVAYGSLAEALANLIDGKVEQHYGTADPSTGWEDVTTKALHLNDLWYHTTDKLLYVYTAGDDPETQGTVEAYYWAKVENQDAIDAASAASDAQDTADGKRRVFTDTPAPPYDVGDLWDRGDQAGGGIWRANAAKASNQQYSLDDWQVVADATFTGTAAGITDQGPFATLDSITQDNISTYIAAGAITDAYIGNTIQSATYKPATHADGPAGWKIDKAGGMEMKDATFFGTLDIDSGSGSRLVIKSDRIEVWEGTTLRVRLGNLNP